LRVQLDLETTGATDSFTINGLSLEGAKWINRLEVSGGDVVHLKASQMRWVQAAELSPDAKKHYASIPVYLDATRSELLLTVELPVVEGTQSLLIERAVALFV